MKGPPHEEHLDPAAFYRGPDEFGDLLQPEVFALHLHWLAACPECARRALAYLGLASLDELAASGGELAGLLAAQKARDGEPLLAWLDSLPAGERLARVEADPRLRSPEVVAALLARCREVWAFEPHRALALSRLALAAAEGLPTAAGAAYTNGVLRGRAWAYHGNVQRILSDLREAARAFAEAGRWIQVGASPDLDVAELRCLEASLLSNQRRFAEALAAVDEAVAIYRDWGHRHEEGRAWLKRAKVDVDSGDSPGALRELDRARELLDLRREPRLEHVLNSVRLHALCDLERFGEARQVLPAALDAARRVGSSTDRLRILWCRGRAAAAVGSDAAAEADFREVRQGFLDAGIPFYAAQVTLDLGLLYTRSGHRSGLRELASEMLPIFESRGVAGESLAALCLFTQAAMTEQVTLELLEAVRRRFMEGRERGW
jgi:tetratricopeptide (TPR) repeat protein